MLCICIGIRYYVRRWEDLPLVTLMRFIFSGMLPKLFRFFTLNSLYIWSWPQCLQKLWFITTADLHFLNQGYKVTIFLIHSIYTLHHSESWVIYVMLARELAAKDFLLDWLRSLYLRMWSFYNQWEHVLLTWPNLTQPKPYVMIS